MLDSFGIIIVGVDRAPPLHGCDHTMRGETSAQRWTHFQDLQVAHVGIGGDPLLDDRSERMTDQSTKQCEHNRKWNADDPPEGGFCSSHREPGQSPGEKRSGGDVGPASGMDGESAFAGAQTRQGLSRGGLNIVCWKIAEDEEAGRVGMSSHGLSWMCLRQDVERGMFERMVATRFENKGKIQNGISHAVIIPLDGIVIARTAKQFVAISDYHSIDCLKVSWDCHVAYGSSQ